MTYEEQLKRAQKDGTIENLTPIFKEFRVEGEKIIGELISYAEVDSAFGEGTYNQYLFQTDEGLVKFSLGAAIDKEIAALMKVHDCYIIEFLGPVKISGKRTVNKFKVERFPAETEPVGDKDDDIPFDTKGI